MMKMIPLCVTFNLKVAYLVTEATLRVLFSEFGDVVDVTLKKSSVEEVRALSHSTAVVAGVVGVGAVVVLAHGIACDDTVTHRIASSLL